jgi:hypothetical protein
VKKSVKKAVAVSAVFAAALAGGVAANAPAVAQQGHVAKAGGVTKFGYKAYVFGTKVVVNGVELKTLRDAVANQQCTRVLGGEIVRGSDLGTDGVLPIGNDLIHISPSTSKTLTYREGKTYGVRGINTIADIKLGGTVDVGGTPVSTPVLKIQGLQSIADSWNDTLALGGKGKFGHAESFGFGGISLELPDDAPVPAEVQDLLDIITQEIPVAQIVNQLIDLLESVGVIEIPGLGSLALGHTHGKATAHNAESAAYALKIRVDNPQDHSKTVVELGRAYSRVTDGVPSGVFRSTMSALDLKVGDVLHFGGVDTQNIPCEGTNGKTQTHRVGAASIPGLISISGVKYSGMGQQLAQGKAASFVQTQIGRVEIPAVQLVVTGLTSRVDLKSPGVGQKVQRKVSTDVSKITIAGKTISLKPGESRSFDGGILRYQVRQHDSAYGTEVRALKITLFEQNVVLTLGQAAGSIIPR